LGSGTLGIYTDGSNLINGGTVYFSPNYYLHLTKLESTTGNFVKSYWRLVSPSSTLYNYIHTRGTKVLAINSLGYY